MRGHVIHLFWWLWGSGFSYVVSDYVLQILGIAETDMLRKIIVTVSVILGFIAGLYATIRLSIMYKKLNKNYSRDRVTMCTFIEMAVLVLMYVILNIMWKTAPTDYKPKHINGWDD